MNDLLRQDRSKLRKASLLSLLSFPPYSVRHSLLSLREVPSVPVILPLSPSSVSHPALLLLLSANTESQPPTCSYTSMPREGIKPFCWGPLPLLKNIMESPEKINSPGPSPSKGVYSYFRLFEL